MSTPFVPAPLDAHPDCTCDKPPFYPTPWGPWAVDIKKLNTNKKVAQAYLLYAIQHCHTESEAETYLDDWLEVINVIKTDILPKMFFAE